MFKSFETGDGSIILALVSPSLPAQCILIKEIKQRCQ